MYVQPIIKHYELTTFRETSAIKVTPMKIMDDLPYKWKPSHAYHKINTFLVSKGEWDTKEDPGKSIKNALYVQRYSKRHLSG